MRLIAARQLAQALEIFRVQAVVKLGCANPGGSGCERRRTYEFP
jgi:hypothetical protein